MGTRLELQAELETFLGSANVYFQPPESIKISYPAIIYEVSGLPTIKADNINYLILKRYTVTLIHKNPDNALQLDIFNKFTFCSQSNVFKSDNLYHYVYDLYY